MVRRWHSAARMTGAGGRQRLGRAAGRPLRGSPLWPLRGQESLRRRRSIYYSTRRKGQRTGRARLAVRSATLRARPVLAVRRLRAADYRRARTPPWLAAPCSPCSPCSCRPCGLPPGPATARGVRAAPRGLLGPLRSRACIACPAAVACRSVARFFSRSVPSSRGCLPCLLLASSAWPLGSLPSACPSRSCSSLARSLSRFVLRPSLGRSSLRSARSACSSWPSPLCSRCACPSRSCSLSRSRSSPASPGAGGSRAARLGGPRAGAGRSSVGGSAASAVLRPPCPPPSCLAARRPPSLARSLARAVAGRSLPRAAGRSPGRSSPASSSRPSAWRSPARRSLARARASLASPASSSGSPSVPGRAADPGASAPFFCAGSPPTAIPPPPPTVARRTPRRALLRPSLPLGRQGARPPGPPFLARHSPSLARLRRAIQRAAELRPAILSTRARARNPLHFVIAPSHLPHFYWAFAHIP
jgi:hypothetical protein